MYKWNVFVDAAEFIENTHNIRKITSAKILSTNFKFGGKRFCRMMNNARPWRSLKWHGGYINASTSWVIVPIGCVNSNNPPLTVIVTIEPDINWTIIKIDSYVSRSNQVSMPLMMDKEPGSMGVYFSLAIRTLAANVNDRPQVGII